MIDRSDLSVLNLKSQKVMGLDASVLIFKMKDGSEKVLPVYVLESSFRMVLDNLRGELGRER